VIRPQVLGGCQAEGAADKLHSLLVACDGDAFCRVETSPASSFRTPKYRTREGLLWKHSASKLIDLSYLQCTKIMI